jgi:hypothetical protein
MSRCVAEHACPDVIEATAAGAHHYQRHRPETTLLYELVREHLRAYDIDALACACGGRLRFVALVTEPEPIAQILGALGIDSTPPARAPPKQPSFQWQEPA